MKKVGCIYFNLDERRKKYFKTTKDRQLVSVALFENEICTKYLVNQELLEELWESTNAGLLQIPEVVYKGLLSTFESFYEYYHAQQLLAISKPILEFTKLEIIDENKLENILNNEGTPLILK